MTSIVKIQHTKCTFERCKWYHNDTQVTIFWWSIFYSLKIAFKITFIQFIQKRFLFVYFLIPQWVSGCRFATKLSVLKICISSIVWMLLFGWRYEKHTAKEGYKKKQGLHFHFSNRKRLREYAEFAKVKCLFIVVSRVHQVDKCYYCKLQPKFYSKLRFMCGKENWHCDRI